MNPEVIASAAALVCAGHRLHPLSPLRQADRQPSEEPLHPARHVQAFKETEADQYR